MTDTNGYRFPIHENTMKQITKSHQNATLSVSSDETIGRGDRDETRTPSGQIKQAHDEPGLRPRRPTRRRNETGAGDKSSRHRTPAGDTKKTQEKHIGGKTATRRPTRRRNEKQDETSNDRKRIGGTREQLIEANRQGHEPRRRDGTTRRARDKLPRRSR